MPEKKVFKPEGLRSLAGEDAKWFSHHLLEVEIVNGCGARLCKICSEGAGKRITSMPFSTIQEIHTLKKRNPFPSQTIRYDRAGDPFYYFDEENKKDLSDVVIDAEQKKVSYFDIPTHGWLPEETQPQEAAAKLVKWAQKTGRKPFVAFSIDPYGFIGLDEETQKQVIISSLSILGPICSEIRGFYTPEDPDGRRKLIELINATVPPELKRIVHHEILRPIGRAGTFLKLTQGENRPYSTWGYSIRRNGDVFFEADYDHPEDKKKYGNIYTSITTPIERPIPRDFTTE